MYVTIGEIHTRVHVIQYWLIIGLALVSFLIYSFVCIINIIVYPLLCISTKLAMWLKSSQKVIYYIEIKFLSQTLLSVNL